MIGTTVLKVVLSLIWLVLIVLVLRLVVYWVWGAAYRHSLSVQASNSGPRDRRHQKKYVVSYLASKHAVIVTEGPGTTPRLENHAKDFVKWLATTGGFLQIMQTLLSAGNVEGSMLVIDNPKDLRRVLNQYIVNASWPTDYYCDPTGEPPSKHEAIKALHALRTTSKAAKQRSSRDAPDAGVDRLWLG